MRREYFDVREGQELDRNPLGWPYSWPQHRHFSPTLDHCNNNKMLFRPCTLPIPFVSANKFSKTQVRRLARTRASKFQGVGAAVAASHPSAFALGAGSWASPYPLSLGSISKSHPKPQQSFSLTLHARDLQLDTSHPFIFDDAGLSCP